MKSSQYLQVAVGVIEDEKGDVLISLRDDAAHQGGLWEFPGGKVENNETVEQALTRELNEELDISIQGLVPLIKVRHHYSDLAVILDVWKVTRFSGFPKGWEGQLIKWVAKEQLADYSFPEANYPIISAARLPSEYAILNSEKSADLLNNLINILDSGITLIQARLKTLSSPKVRQFFEQAIPLCHQKGASLLINSAVENADQISADGVHLTAQDLMALKQRPKGSGWVAASCHNQKELLHAEKIGIDFVVLAPVLATQTHPGAEPLGWKKFSKLTDELNLPVFALGGLQKADQDRASKAGAQGIAGISAFL